MSRSKNTFRNILTSIGGQFFNNCLRIVCRTAFIYILGKEYLGISSLYNNILTLLSVSELGLSSAITFSLYKPLAEDDREQVKSLMLFYKRAYQVIGLTILAMGLMLMPFLPRLMNGVTDKVNIYVYYLLYLSQSVVSYFFFAYKGTLLIADQKKYLTDIINFLTQMVMNMVQILFIFVTRSFLIYTITSIFCNIVQNMVVAIAVDRRYPYLKEKTEKLDRESRKVVFEQIYATFLNKVSKTIGVATDNLVISTYINVLMVGLYDNYNMIIIIIQKILAGFFQAFTSSIGNLYANNDRNKSEFVFNALYLLNRWLVILCSICFMVLLQPFIRLWIGEEYLLDNLILVIIVGNFATNYMNSAVQIYKDASGLFVRGKYRPAATAVLNLVISIILVKRIGMAGVFLGSIISRMVTTWWYDAWLVFRIGFDRSPVRYYAQSMGMLVIIYTISLVIVWGSRWMDHLLLLILLRGFLAMILGNGCLLFLYGRSPEFVYLISKGRELFLKKKNKKKS